MATTPENSRHGPPRKDEEDGPEAKGDGTPADTRYSDVPNLTMIWGDAPPITSFTPPPQNGNGQDLTQKQPVGTHPAINVSIGSIVDAMQGMLASSRTAVDGYQELQRTVKEAVLGGSVFGQQATYEDLGADDGSTFVDGQGDSHELMSHAFDDDPPPKPDEKVRAAATAYAEAMNPAMTRVLRQCADAIALGGQFIVRMDRAGSFYAQADQQSIFPAPTGERWTT
ncbi:hypothetical protein [Streptomyces sp. NPDC048644]|uniref:hypothetical protein n=1 Tax=Streptomyces sp. NPDC048644 TaxID=3365582 RepID=UPI0037190863